MKDMTPLKKTVRIQQGFTLVEMLLVLVILGTLAGIVYPMVMHRGEDARIIATRTQIDNFKHALSAFEIDNGYFPRGANGLQDLYQRPQDAPNWKGPYLESIPRDPWGHDFSYECPGKHNPSFYDVYSSGPPKKEMVIGNWPMPIAEANKN